MPASRDTSSTCMPHDQLQPPATGKASCTLGSARSPHTVAQDSSCHGSYAGGSARQPRFRSIVCAAGGKACKAREQTQEDLQLWRRKNQA